MNRYDDGGYLARHQAIRLDDSDYLIFVLVHSVKDQSVPAFILYYQHWTAQQARQGIDNGTRHVLPVLAG